MEKNLLNDNQIKKISLLLAKAKACNFLSKYEIKKIIAKIGIDVSVNKCYLVLNFHKKRLDKIPVEGKKTMGLWEPAFWLWILRCLKIIELQFGAILVDFDGASLEYCKTKWELYATNRLDKTQQKDIIQA